MLKNGIGSISINKTKNLKVRVNSIAVKTIFNFTPLKKDSTTNLDDLAPAYLNALSAKTILGIIVTTPAANIDCACVKPQKKYVITEINKTTIIENIFCCHASLRPAVANLFTIVIFI